MNATFAQPAAVSEMEDICAGIMARWNARQTAQVFAPAPKPTREQLLAQLAEAEAGFDPQFAYSDDYSFFVLQQAKSERINALRHELALDRMQAICPVPAFPSLRGGL